MGVDLYRDARIKDMYGNLARRYVAFNKPVAIGEFGCCTYHRADSLGGNGLNVTVGMMADYLNLSGILPKGVVDMLKLYPEG